MSNLVRDLCSRPKTSEIFSSVLFETNDKVGVTIGPDGDVGQPIDCADLRVGTLTGLVLVGNSTSFDGTLGDLSIPIRQTCQ